MRRVLVTGAGGQVGWSLLCASPPEGFDVRGYPRSALDVLDVEEVERLVRDADLVVNAAAYTAVDAAQTDRERCFAINAEAPGVLAGRCAALGVPLIHLSSDYVFDGRKRGAYVEDDPVHPINVYGQSKVAGEEAVRRAIDAHVIVRTSWVFAARGRNFVRTIVALAESTEPLRVVDDQVGAPTAAGDIAKTVLAVGAKLLDDGGPYGTFHYTSEGSTSWYGCAQTIFDLVARRRNARPLIEPITTADYGAPAPRPKNSMLDCAKITEAFAPPRRSWQDGVADVVKEILDAQDERPAT